MVPLTGWATYLIPIEKAGVVGSYSLSTWTSNTVFKEKHSNDFSFDANFSPDKIRRIINIFGNCFLMIIALDLISQMLRV